METNRREQRGEWLKLLVGLAVSGGSALLVFWNVDWEAFWSALAGADYRWLVLSLLTLGLALWLKVLRWQLLLSPMGRVSQPSVFYAISVGYLVNTILPGRLGEAARAYMIARLRQVSLVAVLATVAVDRVLDMVVLALLLALALPTADLPYWLARSGLLLGAGGLGLLVLCIILAYPAGRRLFLGVLAGLPTFPFKDRVIGAARSLCLGVEGLRGAGPLLKILAVSAAVWMATVFIFYFGQLAFQIGAPVWAAVMVTAVTSLGMVVPSSPGYIGVFHYLVVLALTPYGVEREVALGFAVVIHLAETIPLSLMGAFALWRCGLGITVWRTGGEENARKCLDGSERGV